MERKTWLIQWTANGESSEYITERPVFGRFLQWTLDPTDGYPYKTRADAEADARFAWGREWRECVTVKSFIVSTAAVEF